MKRSPLKRKTPLARVSKKRKDELAIYRRRKQSYFLRLFQAQQDAGLAPKDMTPWCEVCVQEGWKLRPATDWHHKKSIGRGGKFLQAPELMLAVSRYAHDRIHGNPIWAKERNYIYE